MSDFGICELSVIPVRETPSDRSEMVNQLLFGDLVIIIEKQEKWIRIISVSDNYEGWVDKKQITVLESNEYDRIYNSPHRITDEAVTEVWNNNRLLMLSMGSTIHGYENGTFFIGRNKYVINSEPVLHSVKADGKMITDKARILLGVPYLWGGKSVMGIDCSGYTQIIYRCCGVAIPRDASQQAENGISIDFIEEGQAGDLAFFDNAEGIITHVGMLLNSKQIIHASGKVRIDSIDHEGIYNNEEKRYTHKLRIMKRIV